MNGCMVLEVLHSCRGVLSAWLGMVCILNKMRVGVSQKIDQKMCCS